MNNKKIVFSRLYVLGLSSLCLLTVGCAKNNPVSKENSIPPVSSEEPPVSSEEPPEEKYNIKRPEFKEDFTTYLLGADPKGFNLTYYSDIYSRGFSWLTDKDTTATELYLVQSDKGEEADFSNADLIEGQTLEFTYATSGKITFKDSDIPSGSGSSNSYELNGNSHKVHVENLEKGKAYSYKIGAPEHYMYGAFIVEKDTAKSITAIQLSDAQTKDADKLPYWRNTFTKAVDTAGEDLDMIMYNGDQFDQNMGSVTNGNPSKPLRILRYTKALDVINDYKFNLPYMTSSGNHEPSAPYSHYLHSDIDFAGFNDDGCYYSYDYDYAHFVVLDTNTVNDAQINWLKEDLADAQNAKWKVVTMHISPYSTGDHSNKSENQKIVEKFTPIFSQYHVDLVLQAHDHTYSKTLPYRWDAAGYTQTAHDDTIVNFDVEHETVNDVVYDKDPNGTYYVTTGAAGHRNGASEEDGIWSECYRDGDVVKGLNPSKTFTTNKYKNEVGVLTQENQYEPYTHGGYTSDQHYEIGDPASGNVNAAMFGILNITENTLSYHSYTVNNQDVKLFDTLDVLKA